MSLSSKDLNYSKGGREEVMVWQSKYMEMGFQKLICSYF